MITTINVIIAVPEIDLVACKKISMNGYPVGDFKTASILSILNKVAIIIPRLREPFMRILNRIDLGTTIDAFRISSDICYSHA